MKKILLFCSLIAVVCFNQMALATNESTSSSESETISDESIVSTHITNQNEISNATIGFSKKATFFGGKSNGGIVSSGRLPTTGESIGIGLSFLGLMLIIIIFRNELKEMIKNKKRNKGEESK